MESLCQECKKIQYLSTLDLRASFWQIPLKEESRKYTAFVHRGRCYEFCVTPFGLSTSTASLVRGLEPVLRGLHNLQNFVDDLLCTSETFEHLEDLEELFARFAHHGLTLNLEKSFFFRDSVKFLGHILTRQGIKPDPSKTQAIHEFRTPRNIKELRGFLGLVNYYNKFTNQHASSTIPLLPLTHKGVKWKWGDTEEKAFRDIKSKFCDSVILTYPNKNKPFYLQTDASNYALGATLYQLNDQNEQEVRQFASRTLKGAEIGYFTTEKELLAIVWGLKKFRSYLLGAKIYAITDHAALTFLKECKLDHGRLTRWALAIQDYQITLQHCEGKKNIIVDILSRPAMEENPPSQQHLVIAKLATDLSDELKTIIVGLGVIQDHDEELSQIKKSIIKDQNAPGYDLINNVLYKQIKGKYRAVIPLSKASQIINECHQMYGISTLLGY